MEEFLYYVPGAGGSVVRTDKETWQAWHDSLRETGAVDQFVVDHSCLEYPAAMPDVGRVELMSAFHGLCRPEWGKPKPYVLHIAFPDRRLSTVAGVFEDRKEVWQAHQNVQHALTHKWSLFPPNWRQRQKVVWWACTGLFIAGILINLVVGLVLGQGMDWVRWFGVGLNAGVLAGHVLLTRLQRRRFLRGIKPPNVQIHLVRMDEDDDE